MILSILVQVVQVNYLYMDAIAIWEFRSNMSSYLEKVKETNSPIIFWDRHKKEYLITPYPSLDKESDIFEIPNILENKAIEKEYNKLLVHNMSDWLDDIHEDLFE